MRRADGFARKSKSVEDLSLERGQSFIDALLVSNNCCHLHCLATAFHLRTSMSTSNQPANQLSDRHHELPYCRLEASTSLLLIRKISLGCVSAVVARVARIKIAGYYIDIVIPAIRELIINSTSMRVFNWIHFTLPKQEWHVTLPSFPSNHLLAGPFHLLNCSFPPNLQIRRSPNHRFSCDTIIIIGITQNNEYKSAFAMSNFN